MKVTEAVSLLKTKNKFLVHSSEPYLVDSFFKEIQKLNPDREINRFYDLDAFADLAMRGEMFSILGRILIFHEVLEENVNSVQKIVSGISGASGDIIILVHSKALPKLKSASILKTECESIKFDKPTHPEVLKWLVSKMIDCGLVFKGDVPQRVLDIRGLDLFSLENEVIKLLHFSKGKEIDVEDCDLIISHTAGVSIFDLVEKFTLKKKRDTFQEFERYSQDQYLQLVNTLLTTLEKIYLISIYKEQGKTPDEVSVLVGIPKFFLKTKYYPVLVAFGRGKLLRVREALCDLEVALKSSRLPKKMLFEHFFIKSFAI